MYFTFAGRLQTRLLSLIGPAAYLGALALAARDGSYMWMFALMALLGLALDAGVYGWLLGYQPRWLTLLLSGLEFALLLGALQALALPGQTVDGWRALGAYVPAWALAWLTMHVALPWAAPRWAEDGGELRPTGAGALAWRGPGEQERRRAFALSLGTLCVLALPWLVAEGLRGERVFTGLLLLEPLHAAAIARVTDAGGGLSLGAALGALARAAGWDPLGLYYLVWPAAAFALLLAAQAAMGGGRGLLAAALGAVAALLLPATWLLAAAALVWGALLYRWSDSERAGRTAERLSVLGAPAWRARLAWPVLALALVLWGAAWARVPDPACYLDEGRWRAAAWLRRFAPEGAVAVRAEEPAALLEALGGHPVVAADEPGKAVALRLETGQGCATLAARFWYDDVCLLEQ